MGSVSKRAPTEKPWADEPFELMPPSLLPYKKGEKVKGCHRMAEEMIIIHNLIIRLINSVYLQSVNVEKSPAHIPAFLNYTRSIADSIHIHHRGEENTIFPGIEQATGVTGIMADEIEQHRGFERGLEEFEHYVDAAIKGEEKYDGGRMRRLIDGFMPILREHLADEIVTLVSLEKYEDKVDWDAWFDRIMNEIKKHGTSGDAKFIGAPLALQGHDQGFEDGMYAHWPGINFVLKLALDWLLVPKHKDWWIFCPCDTKMQPRELPFA